MRYLELPAGTPPTKNRECRRVQIKWPDWQTALGEKSIEWFRENLSEREFFNRWASELNRIAADEAAQRAIIKEMNRAHSIRRQSRYYTDDPEYYREHARVARVKAHGDPKRMERKREYARNKAAMLVKTDANFLFRKKLRTRIVMALKGYQKADGTVALLGCSLEDARKHIESLWKPGMTWENWSRHGWHIDHIIPCNAFDLTDPEQQRKCFHYTNLQPLWALENWQKGDSACRKK